MSEVLEPKTYSYPQKYRLFTALNGIPLLLGFGLFLGLTLYLGSLKDFGSGFWVCLGGTVLSLGLWVWSLYWYYLRCPRAKYSVDNITLLFEDPDFYVPPSIFKEKIIDKVVETFNPHTEDSAAAMLSGAKVRLVKYKPKYPGTGEEKFGLTQPAKKITEVYAPYVLNYGTCGYELRLMLCHILFPGRGEGEDIEWMKENKLL